MSHIVALHYCILVNVEQADKFVLEPLNSADDCVRCCYGRIGAIFEDWPDTLFIDCNMVDGLGYHFFVDEKSDSVIPGVAVPQDFLKDFLEGEFGVESDS